MRFGALVAIIFYLLSFLPALAAEVPASMADGLLSLECQKYRDSHCSQISSLLQTSINACEINQKAHHCDELAAKKPEIKDLILDCRPQVFCEQKNPSGTDEALACLRGVKDSVVDTFEALRSLFNIESWSQLSELWKNAETLTKEKYHEYACYTPEALKELKCYVFASLIDPTMVAGKGAKLAKARRLMKATETADKVLSKEAFTAKYLHYTPTTKEQNLAWMKLADEAPKNVKFFDVENSVMKNLNDTLKDKNLVTSLTNYHKDLLQSKTAQIVADLKKQYPDLEVVAYSDFKASRFAFRGQAPPDLEKRLNQALKETNQEFADYVTKNNYVKAADHPENWFRGGYGETADQASLAARFSRQASENSLQSYSSATMKSTLSRKLTELESQRAGLQSELGHTSMLEGGAKKTLSADAFDILRKNGNNLTKAQADLKNRFGLSEIAPATVEKMQTYAKSVDEFSPSIRIAQREVANLDEAAFGGLSADMAGMGSKNLNATAKALTDSKDLDNALEVTRQAEKSITEKFNHQKQTFQNVLKEVVGADRIKTICSGDDCIAIPKQVLNDNEKQKILQKLSEAGYSADFRLSFVPEKIPNTSARTQLSVHGESIEKALRKNLADKMEPAKLKGIIFGVDMKTTELNQGGVKLITAQNPQVRLTESEKRLIEENFQKAVEQLNRDLRSQGQAATYRVWNP